MIRKTAIPILLLACSLSADWTEHITINGYASFEYEKQIGGDNGYGDQSGSFDADLLDIVVNVRPTEKVRVAADLTWEHGSATEDDRGNTAVEYAFTEYIHSDMVHFRAGKMFIAFGIYNEIHTAKPAMVNFKEPLSTNKIHKIGGDVNYFPRWGSGVALHGNNGKLDYIVQVTNGDMEVADQDHNPYSQDDNAEKAVSARVKTYSKDLELGASLYHDTFSKYDQSGPEPVIIGEGTLSSYGIHAIYRPTDDLTLQAELVAGTLKDPGEDTIERYSMSLMPVYDISDSLRAYYIYELFDPNNDLSDDRVQMHSLGLNINLDKSLYIKCELFNVDSQSDNTKLNGADYTELRTAFVVGF